MNLDLPEDKLAIEADGPSHRGPATTRMDASFERVRGIKILRLANERALRGEFAPINDCIGNNR